MMTSEFMTPPLRKTYEEQRKDRMHDAIHDYLDDEKVDSRKAYEEM